jgi:hypothetical protein
MHVLQFITDMFPEVTIRASSPMFFVQLVHNIYCYPTLHLEHEFKKRNINFIAVLHFTVTIYLPP